MSTPSFIPVNEPDISAAEREAVLKCLDQGWISSEGPFVAEFEAAMAARAGRRHGIAVANGTAALEAAIVALNLGPGDQVILPTFTIISCAGAVVKAGATPVVVDCDPVTFTMVPEQVEAAITPRTRAIMAVHIYGLPADMTALARIANRHGLALIEDAAEAHGLLHAGRPCGSFGRLSIFSFYANKHVTTGEGGMIVTDDDALAERCRSLRNLCFQPARRFVHEELGWNLRMTSLQAALGTAQLGRLDNFIARKRAMGQRYTGLLRDTSGLQLPVDEAHQARNGYWVYGVVLADDVDFDAAEAMKRLAARGVGTRPFFFPMHEQPVFRARGLFAKDRHPVSERIARRGFYLPSGLKLTTEQIDSAAVALREIMR